METQNHSKRKFDFIKMLNGTTIIAPILIVLLQFAILYLILNPINIYNQLTTVQVINEVVKTVSIPPNELPQVGIIGDKKNLQNIDELKKGNAIDAEIYKDAKNGDYVIGYTSKLIIYRPDGKKIVYEGDTPQQKIVKSQQNLVAQVQKKTLEAKLISDQTPVPQASLVTDPEKVRSSNEFYKDVQLNDIVANFTNPNLIVIYRPSSDSIIKSGQV
jgi:hypothetical protein